MKARKAPRSALAILILAPLLAPAQPLAPTPAQTEGPYFKAGSPERSLLREPSTPGPPLRLEGRALDGSGRPLPGLRIEFWQADGGGAYDNAGYRLRGHLFTDAAGGFVLETVLPGAYSGRARHIHVKLLPRGGPALTTQLYFAGDRGNAGDPLVDSRLFVGLEPAGQGFRGRYDFVLGPPR